MTRFDAILVGTGQAAPALAVRLATAGMKVAVAERERFGGTCVNTGCIPTKTLVASARAIHIARRGAEFGFSAGPPVVDMKRVKARKDEVVGKSRRGLEQWLRNSPGITLLTGHARFEGPYAIRVGDQLLEADKIFINVGGRAQIPPVPGIADTGYLTNSSMMEVDFLPEHLIVLGGSYVGLEFAQIYRRFGSRVTVLERHSRLIPKEDEDITGAIRKILETESIDIVTGAAVKSVQKKNGGIVIDLGDRKIEGSHLLVATGRTPNTDDLGLDKAGIERDSRGFIKVDDQLRTNVTGVWALGDCNGRGAFTHTSYNDYEIVAANLLDNDPRRVSDRIVAYALYIDPPLGRCGLTEAQVRAAGYRALIGTRPMTRIGRAVEKGETQGFLKILVDAETRLILGACLLGIECDEAVHSILDIMYARAPYTTIQRAVHIHPTVSELVPTVLGELRPLT